MAEAMDIIKEKKYTTPGQRLGHVEDFVPGSGTYVRGHHIYASVVGEKQVEQISDDVQLADGVKKVPYLSVIKEKDPVVVPEQHSVVTARITKVNPRFASALILCVGPIAVKEPFQGMIRLQDVRQSTEPVEMYKCYRPGDIIKAEVISLGDARSYFLSTAKNELGVIFCKSVNGATMIPVSWDMMQCPVTKMKEYRKVARPDDSSIQSTT
eukprot:TRINITY_DN27039_c0_g1_i1.p1 TRINITY_DN27039_c0_g1~~TRINITY_DN27039_c0_g1_i1.p1  ORF type:complete len:211 (-),score=21.92 TRINITY_DN27039_c0_g1_i1:98-730(-)